MSIYYDPTKLLSYNSLFSFCIGSRGVGKTFGFKKLVIKRFLKKKRKFIYLRRYATEFEEIGNFFNDIHFLFPDVKFEVKGMNFYINDELAGYGIALSTALKKKSVSYHDVDYIIFDEFIIESKVIHYLRPSEPIQFLEFFESVARMRENCRAVFLSNNVALTNPYFLHFNLHIKKNKQFQQFGHMIVEYVQNEEFVNAKFQTRFGQLIKGTKYGDYAVLNESLTDNDNFIEKKTGNAVFRFSIHYMGYQYGFWTDYRKGLIYMSDDVDPSSKLQYSLTDDEHKPNVMLIKTRRKSPMLNQMIEGYEKGFLRFETSKVKSQGLEMIKLLY